MLSPFCHATGSPPAMIVNQSIAMASSLDTIIRLTEQFNRKTAPVKASTTFAGDLELDSLTVMDLVAAIEDEFDIILPLNMLPDLETVQQVSDAVDTILKGK
jgi:acyl carrier protein